MAGEQYIPLTPLSVEQRAANEVAELHAALQACVEIYALEPGATWLDAADAQAAREEEVKLREDEQRLRAIAPSLGLNADDPIEEIRAADRKVLDAFLADFLASRTAEDVDDEPIIPTDEQVIAEEAFRLKIIEWLGLPIDTSSRDAKRARIFAKREVARQSHIRSLGLALTSSPEEVSAAEEAAKAKSEERRAAHERTRPTQPEEIIPRPNTRSIGTTALAA